jgi:RNA polymerase sigma-70 factor (ECF subfamily)
MSDSNAFVDFVRRIRAGDDRAAEELVRQYEPLIRREVRLHLDDRRLRRLFDSMDVCQSVLQSFFLRTAAGQYDLEEPGQLLGLLVAMARKKVAAAARREHRQRRDCRRVAETGREALEAVADDEPSPSACASGKELLQQFHEHLSAEERQVAELRREGLPWADVAARLGGTAQARRMQYARAVERVVEVLGLDPAV